MAFDAFASRFTVSGSTMSCLATFAILLYCLASRARHTSLRHALVVNLCLANFLNTLNTTISGFIYVDVHQLNPGYACRANGFFALMTAQAVDFTILTIVLVTLLAVTRLVHLPIQPAWRIKLLACSSTWAAPLVTSLTAVIVGALEPVDNNWCGITAMRPGLRYALERGWRLAIMLLAMCLYAFAWWFVRKHRSLFSATVGMKILRGLHTCSKINEPALTTSAPSGLSVSHPSLPAASHQSCRTNGAGCSELSLPLQGNDFPAAEFHEREEPIDSRTNRVSRWTYIRHPGIINSISAFKSQSQSRLLTPQTSVDFRLIRPTMVNVDPESPEQLLHTLPSTCPPSSTRPSHHSQYPKVHKSLEISTDESSGFSMYPPAIQDEQTPGAYYHELTKSVNSVGAQTQSSFETVPWRVRSTGQSGAPEVKWPFFDTSSSPVQSSNRTSTSTSVRDYADSGPRSHHIHCSKVTGYLKTCVDHKDKFQVSRPAVHLQMFRDSTQRYHSNISLPQETPSHDECDKRQGLSEPLKEDNLPVEHSLGTCISHVRNTAASKPKYHSQCPKVRQTFELSVNSPQGIRKGPNYHSQCPKVTRTFSIFPSGSAIPKPPSLILRPDVCSTKTTIITAPKEPPPSPTPGLPPPPWSAEMKQQRRKTFLLSRSTWSDSMSSQHPPSTSGPARSERQNRRTLLLNAYPLAYFVLTLPWMVDCFIDVQGDLRQDRRAMRALLGLPQYLGLVNAIIFSVNEYLKTMRQKAKSAGVVRVSDEKRSLDPEGI